MVESSLSSATLLCPLVGTVSTVSLFEDAPEKQQQWELLSTRQQLDLVFACCRRFLLDEELAAQISFFLGQAVR
jgi:hypothetical protein